MSNKKRRRPNPHGPVGSNGHNGAAVNSGNGVNGGTKEFSLAEQSKQYTTLATVMERYDLVEVVENYGDPFVIVSERGGPSYDPTPQRPNRHVGDETWQHRMDRFAEAGKEVTLSVDDRGNLLKEESKKFVDYTDVSIGELGSSSVSPFTSWVRREYNQDLVGIKGLQQYDKMRKSDGTVKGTLRAVKTPVLSARWFVEPDDNTKVSDKNAADFVWDNLTHMSITWPQFLIESLLMCEFGYYMFEIVWEERIVNGQTRLCIKKLAPRHPMDVWTWHFDENGGPAGVTMLPPTTGMQQPVDIPISKLVVFTFDREAGDIEGISILRSAYKHWFYMEQLYKIDAIQKERHGIGIPIIKLPPGFSQADKTMAENMGRNLRTNERAHIVLPPNWDILFAKLEGQRVDCLESIKEHKEAIRENILLGFMGVDTTTTEEDQTMFLKATRFIADIVCETINTYLIPKIIDANFSRVGVPKLKARRIGEQADWRTLSFAIRNLIGAGALVPDDPLEEMLRDEMDLPLIDKATRRIAATPMNRSDQEATPSETPPKGTENAPGAPTPTAQPGDTGVGPPIAPGSATTGRKRGRKQRGAQAGLPRQGPPPNGQQRSNAGRDNSGSK